MKVQIKRDDLYIILAAVGFLREDMENCSEEELSTYPFTKYEVINVLTKLESEVSDD